MRRATPLLIALLGAALLLAAPASAARPCQGPEARSLLCPNLTIGPAAEIFVERAGSQVRLRATSDVRSRGRGPIEVRGLRNGWRKMRVIQRIYRAGGGHRDIRTRASLRFTDVGPRFGGGYWKVHELARLELRRVLPNGRIGDLVRTSPKLNYCLRDLERTWAGPRSPATEIYPACNQNPYRHRVTLGTSVGWSDIYPAPYDLQWIDVRGLRGCFSYSMVVDPQDLFDESNEDDNTSHRLVELPFTADRGCGGLG